MILITSSAYVGHELAAELGQLPACFLPVGNRRLFSVQLKMLQGLDEPVAMSLPEGFRLPDEDRALLEAHGVQILYPPCGITLAESLRFCIAQLLPVDGPLRILHGDTLIHDIPFDREDVFSKGETDAYYSWAEFRGNNGKGRQFIEGLPNGGFRREVLSGYFCFSSAYAFLRSLTVCHNNFIEAMNLYAVERALQPLETGQWFDFGHLQTYYRSKALLTTERAFNSLMITPRIVTKTSTIPAKIEAESHWMQSVPAHLHIHLPRLLQRSAGRDASYQLEYMYLSSLSELFVFGELPPFLWEVIFSSCEEFMSMCRNCKPGRDDVVAADGLYLDKTLERLERFAEQQGIDLTAPWTINGRPVPGLVRMAEISASAIPKAAEDDLGILHGDLCFSNILYDFRHELVKVIDPRGMTNSGEFCIHGDMRYDVAKLHHSVVGRYDFIKADRFSCTREGRYALALSLPQTPRLGAIESIFRDRLAEWRMDPVQILAISVQLFLSMLPLHADHPAHQHALLANGMRLFSLLESDTRATALPTRPARSGLGCSPR